MNAKGKGSGCLTSILVFSFFAGNMFLFSGDLGSGGDLEENPFAIIMVLIAIVADIALVGCIISACVKSSERRQEEREKQRINEASQKVSEMIHRYTPRKTISLQNAQAFNADTQFINKEVVFTVKQFKAGLKNTIIKCNEVDSAINRILSCRGCSSVYEKLEYLSSRTDELQRLKSKSDLLHDQISKRKISLLNEDGDILFLVKKQAL